MTWIAWDSGFRGTDLRIGDRIVGVNDDKYQRASLEEHNAHAIGAYAERCVSTSLRQPSREITELLL